MKKYCIVALFCLSISGEYAMQPGNSGGNQDAPDEQSAPDNSDYPNVPEQSDIPSVPQEPDLSSQKEWATGMYDKAVSHIPEIKMSGVGQGSYYSCWCNRVGFKTGCEQCRNRNDCLFAMTCGCCGGLWCLNDQGRIVPILLLERTCCACKHDTPLDQIPDSKYSSCSQIMLNGCVCSTATVSLLLALWGCIG